MKTLLLLAALNTSALDRAGWDVTVETDPKLKESYVLLIKGNSHVYVNPKSRSFIRFLKARGYTSQIVLGDPLLKSAA